jgi:hypothetical protein
MLNFTDMKQNYTAVLIAFILPQVARKKMTKKNSLHEAA